MLIYVDDIIVTGTHLSVISTLIVQLQTKFPIKDLGTLAFFLGTHMLGAKPATSPCSAGSKLSKLDGDPLPDFTEYRQVVGALLYCTLTRPEPAYSVNQLCQHMHSPSTTH